MAKQKASSGSSGKNSLVKNINARKKSGTSRPKSKSTISKRAYKQLKNNWGKGKKTAREALMNPFLINIESDF